jgi:integrase/recombinase XerD
MNVTMYRKHHPKNCKSKDTQICKNQCPIWIRGTAPNGNYVRGPVNKTIRGNGPIEHDWERATKTVNTWENGEALVANATIEKWRDDYLANAVHENLAPETIRKHAYMFKRLVAFAQDHNIRTVRGFDVATTTSFRATWKVSPRTSRASLTCLRSLMKFAVARDWLSKNPAKELKSPQVPDSNAKPFDKDEMKRILAAAKSDPRTYAFIVTMRASGLRISDVTKLAVSELGDDNRLRLVQTKTRKAVNILLGDADAAVLRSVAHLNPNKKFFFQTGEAKSTSAAGNWSERLKEVFKAAKVPDGHSHQFRHTFSAEFLAMGKSIQDLSKLLGHDSVNTTIKHYNKWIQAAQDRLDVEVADTHDWRKDVEGTPKDNVRQMGRKA